MWMPQHFTLSASRGDDIRVTWRSGIWPRGHVLGKWHANVVITNMTRMTFECWLFWHQSTFDPHISSRRLEVSTGIPKSTILRILKARKYYAYYITLTQALLPADVDRRLEFCRWALQQIDRDPNFFRFVMFSDEATFKNTGELNRHNCHYWSDTNPHWHRAIDNQWRWSLHVWCGIVNGYLVGPFFFERTVNANTYLDLLTDQLPHLLENIHLETRRRMFFQQDGAPPHFARIVRRFLDERYPNRWIGREGPIAWPPRSPDLTSLDFYLWGYLKGVVFEEGPTTREDMENRIRRACEAIPRNVLLSTVAHFQRRLNYCMNANGETFENHLNN